VIVIRVLAWALYMLALTPLWLLGWPVCAALSLSRAWKVLESPYFANEDGDPRKLPLWPYWWAFPWNSFEDGVLGNSKWTNAHQNWPQWRRALVWCAWRNPVDAMRFVWPFGIRIQPWRIRVRGNCLNSPQDDWLGDRALWSYVTQGVFAGFWIRVPHVRGRYAEFRIGWRLLPRDARGVPADDGRLAGCGFALQVHLWRK